MAMPGNSDGKMGAGAICGAGRGVAVAAVRMAEWGCAAGGADVWGFAPGYRGMVTPGGRRLLIWLAKLLRGGVELNVARANRKLEQQA